MPISIPGWLGGIMKPSEFASKPPRRTCCRLNFFNAESSCHVATSPCRYGHIYHHILRPWKPIDLSKDGTLLAGGLAPPFWWHLSSHLVLGSGLWFGTRPFRSSSRLWSRLQVPRLSQGPQSGRHVVKVFTAWKKMHNYYMPRHLARTMALLRATSSFVIWTVFSFTFFSSSLKVSQKRNPCIWNQLDFKAVDSWYES